METNCCFELRRQLGIAEKKAAELSERASAHSEERESLRSELVTASQRMDELKKRVAIAEDRDIKAAKKEIELNDQIVQLQKDLEASSFHSGDRVNTETEALTKKLKDAEAVGLVYKNETEHRGEEMMRLARLVDSGRNDVARVESENEASRLLREHLSSTSAEYNRTYDALSEALAEIKNLKEALGEAMKTKDIEISEAKEALAGTLAVIEKLQERLARATENEAKTADDNMYMETELDNLREELAASEAAREAVEKKAAEQAEAAASEYAAKLKAKEEKYSALIDQCDDELDAKEKELVELRADFLKEYDAKEEAKEMEQEMTEELQRLRSSLEEEVESRKKERIEFVKELDQAREKKQAMSDEMKTLRRSMEEAIETGNIAEHHAGTLLDKLQSANRDLGDAREQIDWQIEINESTKASLRAVEQKMQEQMNSHAADQQEMSQEIEMMRAEYEKELDRLRVQLEGKEEECSAVRNNMDTMRFTRAFEIEAAKNRFTDVAKELNSSRSALEQEILNNKRIEQEMSEKEESLKKAASENEKLRLEVAKLTAREEARKAKKEARFNMEYDTVAADDCKVEEEEKEEPDYEIVDDNGVIIRYA